ncbi:MAG TPA: hypothetical protein ENI86_02965 [Acidimicrobiales bacterium]|nr:hypothetical protein [Acidimicrobiales bacterium]
MSVSTRPESDPAPDRAESRLLQAMDAEIEALEGLVFRSRAVMLLVAVHEFSKLFLAVDDLEQASERLGEKSLLRDLAVSALAETRGTEEISARSLLEGTEEPFRTELETRIEKLRIGVEEATEAHTMATDLARGAIDLIGRRAEELEGGGDERVTYGAGPKIAPPPFMVRQA